MKRDRNNPLRSALKSRREPRQRRGIVGALGPSAAIVTVLAVSLLLISAAGAAAVESRAVEERQAQPPSSATAAGSGSAPIRPGAVMVRNGLPANHPTVMGLSGDNRSFLARAEQRAEANPNDTKAWDLFGDVAMRAAAFDLSYYDKAEKAYTHALEIDPNDPGALKGMGNVNYDRRRYQAAIAAYERYLRAKPDDPKVLTDLGTMYLAGKNVDEALKLYRRALAIHSDLFAPRFNLGVAYLLRDDKARAHTEFEEARKTAPDDSARLKVDQMLAKLEGRSAAASIGASTEVEKAPATFREAMEHMVRTLPFAGPKVRSIEWPSQLRAIVVLNDFTGAAMPASDKARLLDNIKAAIVTAKVAHKVRGEVRIDFREALTGRTVAAVTD